MATAPTLPLVSVDEYLSSSYFIPWAVIEILSPEDTVSETLARFQDYESIGVPNNIQMDPERLVAHVYRGGSLIQGPIDRLNLHDSVPFATEPIFAQLRAELDEAAD